MIRTIIIDDEPLAAGLVSDYLSDFREFEIIEICHDGFSGLKAIQKHNPDLIFLDIQMPKISGFEMLELLENPPSVIFTTAFDEYAVKAFDAQAIDYLLKPFSKERFIHTLRRYLELEGKKNSEKPREYPVQEFQAPVYRIVLKVKNEIKIIPFQDVKYLEANDDYVNIHTQEGKFLKNTTLASFEKTLDPTLFVKVHRSYIVNLGEISKIEPYEKGSYLLKLHSGDAIPVSKSGFPRLKAALGI